MTVVQKEGGKRKKEMIQTNVEGAKEVGNIE
jgi:hypothetical protein